MGRRTTAFALAFLLMPALWGRAAAPVGPASPQGDSWRSIAKLPDWAGAWGLDDASFARSRDAATNPDTNNPNVPPLTAEYAAKRLANGAANGGHGPESGVINNSAKCIPNGMPDIMQAPYAFEFLFTPGRVTIIAENDQVRRIFTSRRTHPDDPDPTFNGDSIGHWEGNTLVVDTVAILPEAEFFMGLRTTGKTHVIERMFRKNADTFQIDTTVIDPIAFTKPYRYTKTYKLAPAGMTEYVCEQNNRDNNGPVDLTPPSQ